MFDFLSLYEIFSPSPNVLMFIDIFFDFILVTL